MMLLVLSEDHKEHLSFLPTVETSVVKEFGRIALEFLRRGTSAKIYEAAARKLCVSMETVQKGVEGLVFLLTESSKHLLSEVDFLDSVLVLGFSEELNQFLLQLYQQHHSQIRSILNQLVHSQPAYHNLEWRLDVQLASRSVRQQVVPTVTTRLQLTSGSELSSRVLQIDPSTLLHIISSLEAALAAVKTGHARRILRNIK
ncbi:COMM domain-containing protein 2 [Nothobranchius furzeri]|uniref:COMM domain containing 2 n=6 Tax=Nothobranchius TaxID=28779 RepID=A0A1A8V6W9_NOTFU|nr:COMM domain-containing protein 2 [Nothobranchius furzeri]KAF7203786.1 COMM domain containing 2 [Nothobranchius furzeri]